MKFTLEIDLGNDAMQTDEDVARALQRTGSWFQENSTMFEQRRGWILDENGNDVGSWQVRDATKSDAEVLDQLAEYLHTTPEWDGADFCDLAATAIAKTGRDVFMDDAVNREAREN